MNPKFVIMLLFETRKALNFVITGQRDESDTQPSK